MKLWYPCNFNKSKFLSKKKNQSWCVRKNVLLTLFNLSKWWYKMIWLNVYRLREMLTGA